VRTENSLLSVIDAFRLIDYNKEEFLKENMLCMVISHGGISHESLCSMSFDTHQYYVKEATEIQSKLIEDKEE